MTQYFSDMVSKVRDFHIAFNSYHPDKPTLNPPNCDDPKALKDLRLELLREELTELEEAFEADDIVAVLDALADIAYVTFGAAVAYGLPIREAFDEVHRSNMTKLVNGQPLLNGVNCALDESRPFGKVLKGPNYEPPDLKSVLDKQIERQTNIQE